MVRNPLLRAWLLTLLCVVLLVERVGGAHLHLCFDGQEPPVSYHLPDSLAHHGDAPGVEAMHQDADIALAGDTLSKSDKSGLKLPAMLFAALLLLALRHAPQRFVRRLAASDLPSALSFLRPPLRGPPLLTSL